MPMSVDAQELIRDAKGNNMNIQDVMTFGKYKGKTIEYIINFDPQYIIWLQRNSIREISFNGDIIDKAYERYFFLKDFFEDMLDNSESIY